MQLYKLGSRNVTPANRNPPPNVLKKSASSAKEVNKSIDKVLSLPSFRKAKEDMLKSLSSPTKTAPLLNDNSKVSNQNVHTTVKTGTAAEADKVTLMAAEAKVSTNNESVSSEVTAPPTADLMVDKLSVDSTSSSQCSNTMTKSQLTGEEQKLSCSSSEKSESESNASCTVAVLPPEKTMELEDADTAVTIDTLLESPTESENQRIGWDLPGYNWLERKLQLSTTEENSVQSVKPIAAVRDTKTNKIRIKLADTKYSQEGEHSNYSDIKCSKSKHKHHKKAERKRRKSKHSRSTEDEEAVVRTDTSSSDKYDKGDGTEELQTAAKEQSNSQEVEERLKQLTGEEEEIRQQISALLDMPLLEGDDLPDR